MKTFGLLLCVLGVYFLQSEAGDASYPKKITFLHSAKVHGELNSIDIYEAEKKFKCPLPFGAWAEPDSDCSAYYVCAMGVAVRRECRKNQIFDFFRRMCLPKIMAVCGHDENKEKTPEPATTQAEFNFKCPNFMGTFPHPHDCTKYYTCVFYRHTMKTCPESQLFDAVKSSCKPAHEVDCGSRQRPGTTTSVVITETEPDSTPTEIIIETETEPENTPTEIIIETPTTVISTTEDFPTGPPETDCEEDDVDCIIDETGDITKWFKCPNDIGAHVHPSSDRLFIFCKNWIPAVKKCGMDMVFSEELLTCVETETETDSYEDSTEVM